jgi:hypothetical protein
MALFMGSTSRLAQALEREQWIVNRWSGLVDYGQNE